MSRLDSETTSCYITSMTYDWKGRMAAIVDQVVNMTEDDLRMFGEKPTDHTLTEFWTFLKAVDEKGLIKENVSVCLSPGGFALSRMSAGDLATRGLDVSFDTDTDSGKAEWTLLAIDFYESGPFDKTLWFKPESTSIAVELFTVLVEGWLNEDLTTKTK